MPQNETTADYICFSDCNNLTLIDLIEDGFCNDETNNADCNYDGGDCCGPCTLLSQCLGGAIGSCLCKPNISVMGSMLGLFSSLDTPAQIIFQCML